MTWISRCTAIRAMLGAGLGFAGAQPARAQERPALTLAGAGNDSSTSAVYAIGAGLFAKAGLDVRIVQMRGGGEIAAAVIGGAVQIGHSSLLDIIVAHAKHVPLTLVSPSALIDPSDAATVQLVVRKDSPIRTGRDLNGKTFGVPALEDFTWLAVRAWMDHGGGDSSTLRFVELPAGASVAAISDGRVDGAILSTPVLTSGLASGNLRALGNPFSAVAKRYMQVAWFTTDAYAAAHADVLARFVRVMHDAALYCNTHHAQTVDAIATFAKLDPSVVRGMPRMMFAPYLDAALIQPLIDAAYQYKAIDAPFNARELISRYALAPG